MKNISRIILILIVINLSCGSNQYKINESVENGHDDEVGYLWSFNGDKPPIVIIDFDVNQYYPKEAIKDQIEKYSVNVLIKVDENGILKGAKIVSSPDKYGFDQVALKLVYKFKYEPGYKEKKPVKMAHHITINFIYQNHKK
jgi:protein TonB